MTEQKRIEELAALHALGALDPHEADEFQKLLDVRHPLALREANDFASVAASLAAGCCKATPPSARIRQMVLDKARTLKKLGDMSAKLQQHLPPSIDGFTFFRRTTDGAGWIDSPVPGARVKILSFDPERGAATVLGRLDAGAHYPMHKHIEAEEMYVIEGDLHIGNQILTAGDFHRAEAGTTHGVNHSEGGCTILVVVSFKDLVAQFVI